MPLLGQVVTINQLVVNRRVTHGTDSVGLSVVTNTRGCWVNRELTYSQSFALIDAAPGKSYA